MRILLVGAELEENLANRYLAAAAQAAGHVVRLARFDGVEGGPAVLKEVRAFAPDLVGLSMPFQRRAHEFGALADTLRDAGYGGHLTAGGHFPTFAYEALLGRYPAIDSVVRHEGEATLVELAGVLAAGPQGDERERRLGAIAGLVFRAGGGLRVNEPRPLAVDLDALPMPARVGPSPLHFGIPTAFLVGSRGCYGHCTFCCIHAWIKDAGGPRYRQRSADHIADEMAELRRQRGARLFIFHDDDFFTRDRARDLARMQALRDALRRRAVDDVALVVKARPDDVDPEVFAVLGEIGLLRTYIGVESGSTQGLRTLGRGVDLQTNRRGLALLRALDVYACFNLLLFDPDSTIPSLRQSLAFLRENADVPMNFCRTEIYVGTPLHRRLARQGRLIGDEFGWDYRIADEAAERAFRLFAGAFYDRNFRCDGLMNSNLGLGYHLHLLRHFYPRACNPSLRALAERTITEVNLDCVRRMEGLLDFAASPRATDEGALREEIDRATRETTAANALLEEAVAEATQAIVRAAAGRRARPAARWRSVAAATLALAPLGLDGQAGAAPGAKGQRSVDEGVLYADATVPEKKNERGKRPTRLPEATPFVIDPAPPPADPPPPRFPTVMPPDPPPPPHVTPKQKPPKAPKAKRGATPIPSPPPADPPPPPVRPPRPTVAPPKETVAPTRPPLPPPDPLPPPRRIPTVMPPDPPPPPHRAPAK